MWLQLCRYILQHLTYHQQNQDFVLARVITPKTITYPLPYMPWTQESTFVRPYEYKKKIWYSPESNSWLHRLFHHLQNCSCRCRWVKAEPRNTHQRQSVHLKTPVDFSCTNSSTLNTINLGCDVNLGFNVANTCLRQTNREFQIKVSMEVYDHKNVLINRWLNVFSHPRLIVKWFLNWLERCENAVRITKLLAYYLTTGRFLRIPHYTTRLTSTINLARHHVYMYIIVYESNLRNSCNIKT